MGFVDQGVLTERGAMVRGRQGWRGWTRCSIGAARAAYGWDNADPAAVAEEVILARLLAPNLARSKTGAS